MMDSLSSWPGRRILVVWGFGLVVEALLLLVTFTLLVRPEPPLVAQLRGETAGSAVAEVTIISSDDPLTATGPGTAIPVAPEDSFYTILRWPLTKPLLEGGGRVISMPMRMMWVPVLYVSAVPLVLLGLTGWWLLARRGNGFMRALLLLPLLGACASTRSEGRQAPRVDYHQHLTSAQVAASDV